MTTQVIGGTRFTSSQTDDNWQIEVARSVATEGRSPIAVVGATSAIGQFLLPRLVAAGRPVRAFTRRPPAAPASGVAWSRLDLDEMPDPGAVDPRPPAAALLHLAPMWLAARAVEILAPLGFRRALAISSTSVLTKRTSPERVEQAVVRRLAEGEAAFRGACHARGIAWTIFRPTLIYGGGRDRNVSAIARVVRRVGFFPLPGKAQGRRQPVHADDLALACLAALASPRTCGRVYELPGGSTMTYRDMVVEVFRGLGRRPRLIHVPAPMLRAALRLASWMPGQGHLTAEMANRMEQDLCFDAEPARRDFGYAPRQFAYPDPAPAR